MALTYSWDFPAFDCYPDKGGYLDVVFTVHWRYSASDDAGHTAVDYSTQSVGFTEGDPFIPFADLTLDIVAGWVEAAIGPERIAEMQADLAAQIAQQVTPTRLTLPAPWQTPT